MCSATEGMRCSATESMHVQPALPTWVLGRPSLSVLLGHLAQAVVLRLAQQAQRGVAPQALQVVSEQQFELGRLRREIETARMGRALGKRSAASAQPSHYDMQSLCID